MDNQQGKNMSDKLGPSNHLQQAFNLIGKVPNMDEYSKIQRKNKEMDTIANIVYKYGSWDSALRHTFTDIYKQLRYYYSPISKEDISSILSELRKIYNSNQVKISYNLKNHIRILFGSWNNGLIEAGLLPKKVPLWQRHGKRISEDEIIEALSSARSEISGRLSIRKYEDIRIRKYPWWPSYCTIYSKYGRWKAALSKFNIPFQVDELLARYQSEFIEVAEKIRKILICRPFIVNGDIPNSFSYKDIKIIRHIINSDFVYLSPSKTAKMLLKIAQKNFPVTTSTSAEKGRQFALMYADGLTLEQIGCSVNLSRERVRQYIRKYFDELYRKKKVSKNIGTDEISSFNEERYQYAASLGFPIVTHEKYYTKRKLTIGQIGASRLQKGETLEDIAKSLYISYNSLKMYIDRYLYSVSKLNSNEIEKVTAEDKIENCSIYQSKLERSKQNYNKAGLAEKYVRRGISMAKRYYVVENTPSCLPESDPVYFESKEDAQNYAQELANELRSLGYHVRGNKQSGYYAKRDKNDLGRVIEIMEEETAS